LHSSSHFRWIRPARQARSQQTLERLLDSAEALIADKGFDDVTVVEIAARAGFSVGAVYSRFRDKQGVLHAVQDRFVEEAHLTTENAFDPERWQGASIEEIASEMIVFLVEIHRERLGVLRELLARTRSEAPMIARREGLVTHIGECLLSLLLTRADRIGHPDPAAAVRFGLRFVLGTLEQAILSGQTGAYGIPASDEQLASELTRAFLGYLDLRYLDSGNLDVAGRPSPVASVANVAQEKATKQGE
jgi:AcrR family transcriptional regulator